MSAKEVGNRLVALCNAGKWEQAEDELYADDITTVEAHSMGDMPRETRGKAAVKQRSEEWSANTEVHDTRITGPFPFDDKFIIYMALDATSKAGPMAGQRMTMEEACHYHVKDGKITRAEFYYAM